jgi:DME family drug/metabolite transporter
MAGVEHTKPSHPALGVALVLAAAALWGTTGTAQSLAGGGLSPVWFGALRLAVAAAFFAVYAALTRRATPAIGRLPWRALVGAGVCMAVYNLAFFAGIRDTGVAVGTAIALGSGPLWTGVLQALLLRQLPRAGWWLGTLLAVGGGALLSLPSGRGPDATAAGGMALCLLSGLAYAGYTLIGKGLVGRAPPATITLWAFMLAAALAMPLAWIEAGAPRVQAADIAAVLYVGVATAGIAYLLFAHALHHVSAATGVTLALGEPVMAFALAVLVIGERPAMAAFAGLLLVIAGVAFVVRAELGRRSVNRP